MLISHQSVRGYKSSDCVGYIATPPQAYIVMSPCQIFHLYMTEKKKRWTQYVYTAHCSVMNAKVRVTPSLEHYRTTCWFRGVLPFRSVWPMLTIWVCRPESNTVNIHLVIDLRPTSILTDMSYVGHIFIISVFNRSNLFIIFIIDFKSFYILIICYLNTVMFYLLLSDTVQYISGFIINLFIIFLWS
jgi:hypothetical protein